MARYAMLVRPSANRVYADASVSLTRAELEAFGAHAVADGLGDVAEKSFGGVPYLGFSAHLTDRDVAYLSNVSTAYALFEVRDEPGGPLLRPITLTPLDRYDDDLLTVLKYSGKTNETFTRLLLNLTILGAGLAEDMLDRRLRVLDPMCGRGTTLNQAVMYGYDAAGIDLDGRDFDAYAAFLGSWLKRKRLKHRIGTHPVRHDGKRVARRLEATFSASKQEHAQGVTQQVTLVNADTLAATSFFKPRRFDVIVTDAPYGVQHGSRGPQGGLTRRPLDLLAAALPGWVELLRPGGGFGLSWNTLVAGRDAVVDLVGSCGLEVCEEAPFQALQHRVDQAIVRDLVVARRPQ